MKNSSFIIILISLFYLNNQNQWNILRITKVISNKIDKISEKAYIFNLYTPDQNYEYYSFDQFLKKETKLPDYYNLFNLSHKTFFILDSNLQKFHLKLQFMGGSNTNNKYFTNEYFEKNISKLIKKDEEVDVEDYFFFFRHVSVYNNYLY